MAVLAWHSQIEKTKEKSKRLLRKIVAVSVNGTVIVGKLSEATTDNLFRANYPFVRLTISKGRKYGPSGKLEKVMTDDEVCFANNPDMILSLEEMSKSYPSIHADTYAEIRSGRLD
jgi:hypothetical protein